MSRPPIPERPKSSEGEWIFSYADLMSLLTCFFILLYNTGTSNPTRQQEIENLIIAKFAPEKIKEKILIDKTAEIHRAFFILLSLLNLQDSAAEVVAALGRYPAQKRAENLGAELRRKLADAAPSVRELVSPRTEHVTARTLEVVIPSLSFAAGTATLSEAQQRQLVELAATLGELGDLLLLDVEAFYGGSSDVDLALATRRAQHCAQVLLGAGVSESLVAVRARPLEPWYATEFGPRTRSYARSVHLRLHLRQAP